MTAVTLRNIKKAYGETEVIHGVDLDIEDGEFVNDIPFAAGIAMVL